MKQKTVQKGYLWTIDIQREGLLHWFSSLWLSWSRHAVTKQLNNRFVKKKNELKSKAFCKDSIVSIKKITQ